jgi:uncharacterized membrane protein
MSSHSPRSRFDRHTNFLFELFIAALTLLPFLVLICFYSGLPARIPEYLNLHGDVAVWGRKSLFSVFRLPLMALDLQVLCLLMKYGVWQGSATRPVEDTETLATYREESIKLSMSLADWLRAFIAIKLGASSLEVILYSIERFHSLTTMTRITSWAASILGIAGAGFYGYRLLTVNRKLKEKGGSLRIPRKIDRSHLRGGIFYYNPDDPSWFSEKYLPNFANKWVYLFLVCLLCLPVLMFLPILNA